MVPPFRIPLLTWQITLFCPSSHIGQGESEADILPQFGAKLCDFVHLFKWMYPKNMYHILLPWRKILNNNWKLSNFVLRFRKLKISTHQMVRFFFRGGEILQNFKWIFHHSWLKDTYWKIQITFCLFLFTYTCPSLCVILYSQFLY